MGTLTQRIPARAGHSRRSGPQSDHASQLAAQVCGSDPDRRAPSWREDGGQRFTSAIAEVDDVILARKDAPASYHLACVVDDAASGVSLVVRGADLRSSTPVQRLLQTLLGLPEPTYLHHPLVTHQGGRRLAKRDQAPTLLAMRTSGMGGKELAALLAKGQLPLGFAFSEA
ncbi:glutamate--tRNA ligase family protein [Sphingomonas daechungensis]|uniref:glutamate--tRNA ligase family protein n=1 Tax=Sphingomonas daechungensis TaxID=1176646 RepID=UPI0037DA76CB